MIVASPWNSEFRIMRVEALIKEGELHEALLHLQQLTNFINNNEHGFLKLSLLYYQMGDTESSLAKIRECLKLDQDHKQCFAQYKKVSFILFEKK